MSNEQPIIASGQTADGVAIFLHSNGEISNRLNYYRGRIADPARAAQVFASLAAVQSADVPAALRAAKRSK